MMATLNLVFHRIVETTHELESPFDVELRYLKALLGEMSRLAASENRISQVRVYFDDNHTSTLTLARSPVLDAGFAGVAAVPIESIGQPGYCSSVELDVLRSSGFDVVAHGFSHVALAVYIEGTLRPTPRGGVYRNRPAGRSFVLTEAEVLFQLKECRKAISYAGASEFVLPYGLYNASTTTINRHHRMFDFLTTCDPFLDYGEGLRPRFLVKSTTDIRSTVNSIRQLEGREESPRSFA